ncbi:biotin-dependent carboxyltransferase family protein [Rathayibacter sp. VKM Ac-2878]|nr:biotin-dependent carboxyltransferase family protein [Rathayibacter sp. VKM Ac-2879]MBF4503095.1 biotin-dependent carboxyltransferase family protein [Rathayibacter sp. VKM Ac-2878]
MDRGALRVGNRLLGNHPGAAGLELLGGGFCARFETDAWISLGGSPGTAEIDGQPLDHVLPRRVDAGSSLRLGPLRRGLRRTLAIRGGVNVPPSLGSRSRDTLSALGPEPLRPGDVLPVGTPAEAVRALDWWPFDPAGEEAVLLVHQGPRLARVPEGTWRRLLDGPWRIGAADRVGLRLDGPALPTGTAGELPSEGVLHGSVQLPPSGQPVVFGPDHPATGGYPVIAVVDSGSLDTLAHLVPGSVVRLRAARPR